MLIFQHSNLWDSTSYYTTRPQWDTFITASYWWQVPAYSTLRWLSIGVGILNMGEGAAQDCLWPTLSTVDVKRTQAGVWAVREGASGGRAAREAQQAEREERPVPTTSRWSTSHEQVGGPFPLTICSVASELHSLLIRVTFAELFVVDFVHALVILCDAMIFPTVWRSFKLTQYVELEWELSLCYWHSRAGVLK